MLKVAIVCGAGIVSGKEVMALELGQGLREAGIEIHFVTSRWGSGEFGRRTEAAGFPTYRLWLGFISATLRLDCIWMTLDQLWHWPALFIRYRQFLKKVSPTKVVHTNSHHALLLWPLLRPQRDIFWLHEVIPKKPQYRRLFQRMGARVGCFVTVSNAVAKSLVAIGVAENKIHIIYNGITDPAHGDTRGCDNSQTVGIVGQIGRWKGHEDLLEAFQIILTGDSNVELHIFGNGSPDYEALLRRRISELGLGRNVIWQGFIRDPSKIYSDLTVLVVPSRSEDALPTTAIEAAFFRIPVIASRHGGLPEIIEDGVTGYLFEAGDVAGLAKHAITLLQDAGLRSKIGQNARKRAMSLFSRERFVRGFIDLLKVEAPKAKLNGPSIDNAA